MRSQNEDHLSATKEAQVELQANQLESLKKM